MLNSQLNFLMALHRFIAEVEEMPSFKGKTQAIKALKRVRALSVFND